MLRLSKVLVTLAVILYSIPVTAWLFLRAWRGEDWPSVGLLNAVGIWWFVPLLVLLPIALGVRARQASVMALLLALPAFWLFGADLLPARAPAVPEGAPRLRVLSFNALVSNRSYDAVEALVRSEQPDVVAIQELSPGMADELNARLGADYPYRLVYPWTDPRGIGLWSRLPLTEEAALNHPFWERWGQVAQVQVGGRALRLINVHLWPIGTLDREHFSRALRAQAAQVQTLRDVVAASELPVIVVGDLNASPTNATYETLAGVLDDAWRQVGAGPGFTFPAPGTASPWARPFLRIDYLWAGGAVTPLSIRVLPAAGSDHLPLLGEFALE